MRNKIILLVTSLLCFILQCTVIKQIAIGSIAPNLLIIFVVSMGLMRGQKTALFAGFFVGLLADLFYGTYLGIYAFLYMMAGYLSGFASRIYYDNNTKVPMLLAGLGDLFCNMGVYCFSFLLKGRLQFLFFLKRIMISEMIYTVFFTAVIYRLFYLISHRLMKQDNEGRDTIWLLK